MDTLWRDVKYGAQMLLRKPGFTAAAVITLALGIGANTAIYSVIHALVLNALPFSDLDRIVAVYERVPSRGVERNEASVANYLDWRNQNQTFEHVGLFRWWGGNLTDELAAPERVQGFQISANLFDVLGVQPALGRGFLPEEDQAGRDRVVILTYGLWQRRFAGDPDIIGKTVAVNSVNRVVVGVMPPEYTFPRGAQILAPLALTPQEANQRQNHSFLSIARLKPGVSIAQARADLDTIAARLEAEHPDTNTGRGVNVLPLLGDTVSMYRPALLMLMAAVAFVLLIGCANIANLMLARATGRTREMAIRIALGATRWRIARQLLTESILLALIGGGLGILAADWSLNLLRASLPSEMVAFIPNWNALGLNLPVLGFTLAIAMLAGILFGLAPAIQSANPNLNEALKESAGKGATGIGRRRLRGSLMVAEVALSLILLIGASLMMKSVLALLTTNPGFKPENVLTMEMVLPFAKYSKEPARAAFLQELTRRVAALPAVESAGFVNHLPLGGSNSSTPFLVEGQAVPPPGQENDGRYRVCTPDYFAALGITVINGRAFTDQDRADTQRVIIVNQTLASSYWPNQDPIGKRMRLSGPLQKNPWMTVVGVIADVRHRLEIPVTPEYYLPIAQDSWSSGVLVARTRVDPGSLAAAIREQVLTLDKDQPVFDVRTMEDVRRQSVFVQQGSGYLLGVFGALALVIAAVGIYGVMSYSVMQRTQEIGIRMALGASARDTYGLVVRHGMALTLSGVALGLLGGLGVGKLMSGLLFGVRAIDPLTFTAIPLLLILVALLACSVPARRATKVDPMIALRSE